MLPFPASRNFRLEKIRYLTSTAFRDIRRSAIGLQAEISLDTNYIENTYLYRFGCNNKPPIHP